MLIVSGFQILTSLSASSLDCGKLESLLRLFVSIITIFKLVKCLTMYSNGSYVLKWMAKDQRNGYKLSQTAKRPHKKRLVARYSKG